MEDTNWQVQAHNLAALVTKHVLFLCVQNSARSQMAEGLARHLAAGNIRISSAASKPAVVRSEAIEVLNELDVDSGMLRAKGLDAVDMDSVGAGRLDAFRAVRDELMTRLRVVFGVSKA